MKAKKKLKWSRACCCLSYLCPTRCIGSTISQDSGLSSFLHGLNRSGMVREERGWVGGLEVGRGGDDNDDHSDNKHKFERAADQLCKVQR